MVAQGKHYQYTLRLSYLWVQESSTDEEIDQAFLDCQKQLEKRKNDLKEKLAATSKAKKKGMESQLDKLIMEKNSFDQAANMSGNVLGYRWVAKHTFSLIIFWYFNHQHLLQL